MHVLIVAIGSAGDVHPFLALGQAALARGYRVSMCTTPVFQALVESCGLRFLPVGSADDYTRAMNDPALWRPRTSLRTLWRVIADTLEPLYELLQSELADDCENTVMVGSLWAFSARVLQEKTGVRYFSAQVSPSTLLSAQAPPEHPRFTLPHWWPLGWRRTALSAIERAVIDPLMMPALNRLRARVGLPPVRQVLTRWVHSPDGVLALFPAWFAAPQSDWPNPLLCTGFPLFEAAGQRSLDAALEAFLAAGPPPLVVTAGSTLLENAAFFDKALRAARLLGMRTVVLCDKPVLPPELAADVIQRAHVHLPSLLPRSAVFVHHSGIGTVAQALAGGVPQLVVPFAHDQFDNAARVVSLGCGLRLSASDSVATWAAALTHTMGDPALRSACLAARERCLADSGRSACARTLHALEAGARPHAGAEARPRARPHARPDERAGVAA